MEKKIENKISSPARFGSVMAVSGALLLYGLVLNVNSGSVSIPAGEIFSLLLDWLLCALRSVFTGLEYSAEFEKLKMLSTESRILFSIRLPRMLLAAILGGALSVSGFLLQCFFRNPIAGPFVLGISSGAKMLVGLTMIILARYMSGINSAVLILASFAGSLLISLVVLGFSQRLRQMSTLLVIGIMVGYVCSAVTDFIISFANDHEIVNLTNWSMGTFSGANWENVKTAALLCLPAVLAAWGLAKPMAAYALGEGYAKSMGINIKAFRAALILLSSLLSACVTALAGPVSFVGVAVPHITRSLLKSSKPAYVIPASFLCGAVFCIFCDLIARIVFAPTELAIGTVTSAFGAPVVISMMARKRMSQEL